CRLHTSRASRTCWSSPSLATIRGENTTTRRRSRHLADQARRSVDAFGLAPYRGAGGGLETLRESRFTLDRQRRMGTMKFIGRGAFAGALLAFALGATAQDAKHYRFAHDQQLNTGYSVAYDIFSARLKALSGGKMLVDQYPGAQLGQEPQLL